VSNGAPQRPGWFNAFDRDILAGRPGPLFTVADLALILGLFVATRGALLVVAWIASTGVLGVEPFWPGDPLKTIVRWDSQWYLEIVYQGYHPEAGQWPTGDGTNWAFFPLLPVLIKGFYALTGIGGVAGGLIVTHALFLATLILMFAYVCDLFGRPLARWAVVLFALWPFTIHHSVPMSESVFVPLLLAVLWLARRGLFVPVAFAVAALSASRAVGPFIAFPLLAIAARRHGLWRILSVQPGTESAVFALGACGIGVGLFILYMHGLTGDGLAFTHAQVAWNREFKWPWMTLIDELNPLILPWDWLGYNAFNIAVAVVALVMAWRLYRLRLGPEALFVAMSVVIGLTAGQTTSLPRFMGAMAPLVIVLALWTATPSRRVWTVVIMTLLMLAAGYGWCVESLFVM
jgi:hypothetical protein